MPKLSRYISHETDIKASGIVFCEGEEPKVAGSTSQRHHESTKLLSKVRRAFSISFPDYY